MAYYETLLEIWGEKKFNNYFSADGKNPLRLDPQIGNTPLMKSKLVEMKPLKMEEIGKRSIQIGDEVYFHNIPLYSVKHIHGEGGGFHAICVQTEPVQKFIAFGLDPAGVTEEEMLVILVKEFNEIPLAIDSIVTKEVADKIIADNFNTEEVRRIAKIAETTTFTAAAMIDFHKEEPNKVGFLPRIFCLNAETIGKVLKGS